MEHKGKVIGRKAYKGILLMFTSPTTASRKFLKERQGDSELPRAMHRQLQKASKIYKP